MAERERKPLVKAQLEGTEIQQREESPQATHPWLGALKGMALDSTCWPTHLAQA